MRTKALIAILGLLAPIFAVNLSFPSSALLVDTCFIKAYTRNEYVVVYDLDPRGNKGYELWKGWIRQGTERRIDTNNGHIRYHYAFSDTQPLSGDIGRLCNSGGTIGVP
jgi:hypothetical protein